MALPKLTRFMFSRLTTSDSLSNFLSTSLSSGPSPQSQQPRPPHSQPQQQHQPQNGISPRLPQQSHAPSPQQQKPHHHHQQQQPINPPHNHHQPLNHFPRPPPQQQQQPSFFKPMANAGGPSPRQPAPQSHPHHHHPAPPPQGGIGGVPNFPPSSRSNIPASGSPRSQPTSALQQQQHQQHPGLSRVDTPPNVPFSGLASSGQNPPAVPPRPPGQEFTPLRPVSRSGSGKSSSNIWSGW